jgi:hypothetical protein
MSSLISVTIPAPQWLAIINLRMVKNTQIHPITDMVKSMMSIQMYNNMIAPLWAI